MLSYSCVRRHEPSILRAWARGTSGGLGTFLLGLGGWLLTAAGALIIVTITRSLREQT